MSKVFLPCCGFNSKDEIRSYCERGNAKFHLAMLVWWREVITDPGTEQWPFDSGPTDQFMVDAVQIISLLGGCREAWWFIETLSISCNDKSECFVVDSSSHCNHTLKWLQVPLPSMTLICCDVITHDEPSNFDQTQKSYLSHIFVFRVFAFQKNFSCDT